MSGQDDTRSRLGAWYTPPALVSHVVENTLPGRYAAGQRVTVLDPACGDGRFRRRRGGRHPSTRRRPGPDRHRHLQRRDRCGAPLPGSARRRVDLRRRVGPDALAALATEGGRRWDVVVGNPPFLSPLSAQVRADAGPRVAAERQYADAAVQFLALAVRLAAENGGRVGFVLPLSVLGSRDAGPVREEIDDVADVRWLWWSPTPVFDAEVVTCAIGVVRRGRRGDIARSPVVRSIGPDFTRCRRANCPCSTSDRGATGPN